MYIYTFYRPEFSNGTPFPVVLNAVNHEGKRRIYASVCEDTGER